jgi:hypothetical protein
MNTKQDSLSDVYAFLVEKANSRGLISQDQKILANEYGIPHVRFHRRVQDLVALGQLRVVGRGQRGKKTFQLVD